MKLISFGFILKSYRYRRQNRFGRQHWGGHSHHHHDFNGDYDSSLNGDYDGGFNGNGGGVNGGFGQNQFFPNGQSQQQQQQQAVGQQNPNQFSNQNQNQQQQQQTTQAPAPTGSPSRAFLSCMGGCQALSHYNPVCGTDGQTYHNDQRLGCAQRCGANVQQSTIGACPNPAAG